MITKGRRRATKTQIIFGVPGAFFMGCIWLWTACGGVLFASLSFLARPSSQGVFVPFLGLGLLLLFAGLAGCLWKDELHLNVSERTYRRTRGLAGWAKTKTGSFSDLAGITVEWRSGGEQRGGGYVVEAHWRDETYPGFPFANTSERTEAMGFAQSLSAELGLPVQDKGQAEVSLTV